MSNPIPHTHDLPSDEADAVDQVEALVPSGNFDRPETFHLKIQGGVLENLGIKMYTKVGKVLVEFAANAFDSDSSFVDIRFNAEEISSCRQKLMADLKADASQNQQAPSSNRRPRRKAYVVVDPLPETVTIVIADKGHGMTAMEMAERFLPLNRNRRRSGSGLDEDNFYSEAGKRLVMGRKGIGKLSGFGVAERMVIRSKRAGQPYWTELDLKSSDLRGTEDISNVPIPHSYVETDDLQDHGTTITLSGLRYDSANFSNAEIVEVLNETFYPIKPEEFDIRINEKTIEKPAPEISYIYPENLNAMELETETLSNPDWGQISFKYRVQFRKKRLDAQKRGAYIYSKKRLAMAPTMLSLTTGMHNFMAHQYMECFVECDDIDNLNIDVIGTTRSDIIQNSDIVRSLLARIEEIMAAAIKANGNFKENEADKIIDNAPETAELRRILQMVTGSQRRNARELAKTFLKHYEHDSEDFKHLTPLIVGAANAGGILIDLIRVSNSAETVAQLAPALISLREIERTDAVKLYRARRRGIIGLQRVVDEGRDNFTSGPHDERKLHNLLKAQPWLIRPDLTSFIASDEGMSTLLDRIAKELAIDNYAKPAEVTPNIRPDEDADDAERKKTVRPDLVGLIGNGPHPNHVFVIELKAPSIALRVEHLNQLKGYMRRVREFLEMEYPTRKERVIVEGALIGAMPKSTTKVEASLNLLEEVKRQQVIDGDWEVIGLNEMLRRTNRVHSEFLTALTSDEDLGFVAGEDATGEDLGGQP